MCADHCAEELQIRWQSGPGLGEVLAAFSQPMAECHQWQLEQRLVTFVGEENREFAAGWVLVSMAGCGTKAQRLASGDFAEEAMKCVRNCEAAAGRVHSDGVAAELP